MGYRHDVAVCLAFEDNAKRDAFYDLLSLRDDEVGEVVKTKCAKDDSKPWITCQMNDTKFYYESTLDAIFDLVVECGGAWRMLRIGEDASDVEDRSDCSDYTKVDVPWDAFYMERRIVWE